MPAKTTTVLKTLKDHDKERRLHWMTDEPDFNGIACPSCGQELVDSTGEEITTAIPKIHVHCNSCGWNGTRVK